jgi:hypothetical protein
MGLLERAEGLATVQEAFAKKHASSSTARSAGER